MKKKITVFFVGLLAVVAGATAAHGAGKAGNVKVAYVTGMKGLPFFISVNCGARAAAKQLGVDYSYQGPQDFDATQQIPILNAVIAQKPDAIVISPTDQTALIAPLKQAQKQGIKITMVDTTVADPTIGVSRVSSDNVYGGTLGADALAKLLKGKKGTVFVLSVKPGISTTDQRGIGFTKEIKKYKNLKFVGIQYNQGTDKESQTVVSAMIAKHPDLVGIFGAGNVGSEGTAAALRAAKVQNRVTVVQYDAAPAQVVELKQHIVDALVAQDPSKEGADAVVQALNAVHGKAVKKTIVDKLHIITRDALATTIKYAYKTTC
jgi:ribose transport system substrate-binding protein